MDTKTYKIGKYKIHIKNDNIICECIFGSLYPDNYITGNKICRHIQQLIKLTEQEKELIQE